MLKKILAVAVGATLIATGGALQAPQAQAAPTISAPTGTVIEQNNIDQLRDVFNGINQYRASKGLPAVKFSPQIAAVAQNWSGQMARDDRMYHNPNFTKQYPMGASGYGEIIARRYDESGKALLQQWINSPPHEALLRGNFNVIGPGVAFATVGNTSRENMWGTVNLARYNNLSSLRVYNNVDEWVKATGQDTRQHAEGAITGIKNLPGGVIEVSGWAFDNSRRNYSSDVEIRVGATKYKVTADKYTIDLSPYGTPGPHGFVAQFEAEAGKANQVCATALNTYGSGNSNETGCSTVNVPNYERVNTVINRYAGVDRWATAATLSRNTHRAGSVDTVYLASGVDYPDALSAAPAAAQPGKSMLLTYTDRLMPDVATELKRLNPKNVILVGGTPTLTEGVATQTKQALPNSNVTRISGADRYQTSIAIAKHAFPNATKAYMVSGEKFPDALSAAPVAAQEQAPVILVPSQGVPVSIQQYLQEADLEAVTIAGGPETVSALNQEDVATYSGAKVTRVAGESRYETNLLLHRQIPLTKEAAVYVASGEKFPDALAAAAVAGKNGSPLLLTPSSCVPKNTFRVLKDTYQPGQTNILGSVDTLGLSVGNLGTCTW